MPVGDKKGRSWIVTDIRIDTPGTANIRRCRSRCLPAILLELPVSVVQGANLTSLQPTRYAVEMERVLR